MEKVSSEDAKSDGYQYPTNEALRYGDRVDRTPFRAEMVFTDEGVMDVSVNTLGHGASWRAAAAMVDRVREVVASGPQCRFATAAQIPGQESGRCFMIAGHATNTGSHHLITGYPFGADEPGAFVMDV